MRDYGNTDWVGYAHDLKYEIRKLRQQVAELEGEIHRLKDELELYRNVAERFSKE